MQHIDQFDLNKQDFDKSNLKFPYDFEEPS